MHEEQNVYVACRQIHTVTIKDKYKGYLSTYLAT